MHIPTHVERALAVDLILFFKICYVQLIDLPCVFVFFSLKSNQIDTQKV